MTNTIRFDSYLESLQADYIKILSRVWGQTKSTRKSDMIQSILHGLNDPKRVAEVVKNLSPMEQAALAIFRNHAGRMQLSVLASSLVAAGYMPKPQIHESIDRRVLRDLQNAGILIPDIVYNNAYGYGFYGYANSAVISDERILAQATPLSIVPFNIPELEAPADVRMRRPITIILDIIAFLQAIENIGGVQLNKNGSVRVGDIRKLCKALGWAENEHSFDGLVFHHPIDAFLEVFESVGLLTEHDGRLASSGVNEFAKQPVNTHILKLINAFLNVHSWHERGSQYMGYGVENAGAMRNAVLLAISSSTNPGTFMSISDVSTALYSRVAHSFSLSGMTHPYFEHPHINAAEKEKARERYDSQLRNAWKRSEEPWIALTITGWMYFLGLVEIGFENSTPVLVRFSALGRQILQPQSVATIETSPGPAWMVQPDFEVMVYLDHVSPLQLSLLEQIAERVQIQAHMARYRLTRDSIYQAMERGLLLDDILTSLAEGSGLALPQNVSASLRDWGAQRDKYTLYRYARLLELPSQAVRNAMLNGDVVGTAIGEHYILLKEESASSRKFGMIDYNMPLPAALSITEDGNVSITRKATDVLLRPMLDRWAEPQPDGSWQFTPASIASVTRRGGASTLLNVLDERLTHKIPPMLAVTLRAWAGERIKTSLGRLSVIQFDDANVTEAVRTSQRFEKYILGGIGANTLVINQADLQKVRELLAASGIEAQEIDQ